MIHKLLYIFVAAALCACTEQSSDDQAIYPGDCFRKLGSHREFKVTGTTHARVELKEFNRVGDYSLNDWPKETVNREYVKIQCPKEE